MKKFFFAAAIILSLTACTTLKPINDNASETSISNERMPDFTLTQDGDSLTYKMAGLTMTMTQPKGWTLEENHSTSAVGMYPFTLFNPSVVQHRGNDEHPYGKQGDAHLSLQITEGGEPLEDFVEELRMTEEDMDGWRSEMGDPSLKLDDFQTTLEKTTISGLPAYTSFTRQPIAYEGSPKTAKGYHVLFNDRIFSFWGWTLQGAQEKGLLKQMDDAVKTVKFEDAGN